MRDILLLFAARCVRMFAYGMLSVVLLLYLRDTGLSEGRSGLLLTLTLIGDTAISLWLTLHADQFGRKRTLWVGALLMAAAGLVFALSTNFSLLLLAATIGVISPHGTEVGPFLSVEQAALSGLAGSAQRTRCFAWYHLAGFCASALGAYVGGVGVEWARTLGCSGPDAYRPLLFGYAGSGLLLLFLTLGLSPRAEPAARSASAVAGPSGLWFGLHRSRGVVLRLSLLFALDAFGGGFILQSIMAYWLHTRHGLSETQLGEVFFAANLLSAASALAAGWLADRIGLVPTMVFTHLPSNVLVMLLPLAPNAPWAVVLLLLRNCISQMDVPTRQAYTMAVVAEDERSAAAGVTGVARSVGAAVAPALSTSLLAFPMSSAAPFLIAGGIKILYDLLLYRAFARHRGPEE